MKKKKKKGSQYISVSLTIRALESSAQIKKLSFQCTDHRFETWL